MYIEDDELRDLYKTFTPERLQKLETCLIHLEKNPQDLPSLEEFLREAHTLKGDSRMLGVEDVETLIHQMEDTAIAVKQGKQALTGQMCDRLHYGLDAVRKLVREAVTGEASGVNTFLVLAQLMGAEESSNENIQEETVSEADLFDEAALFDEMPSLEEAALFDQTPSLEEAALFDQTPSLEEAALFDETPSLEEAALFDQTPSLEEAALFQSKSELLIPKPEPKIEVPVAPPVQEPPTSIKSSTQDFETIRVKTENLDDLARQVGELSIAQLRISRLTEDVNQLLTLWEEWNQDYLLHRKELQQLQQGVVNGNLPKVQNFQQRSEQRLQQLGELINQFRNAVHEDDASLTQITNELETGVQNLRLLPLSKIFNPLQRLVRDLSRQQGKQIHLVIEGGDTRADKKILQEIKDPLLHLIRNSIDHGIETPQEREQAGKSTTATITLKGYTTGSSIGIDIVDDGRGLDLEKIKRTALRRDLCTEAELAKMTSKEIQSLIFANGFSTRTQVSQVSGRGVGLDIVRANVEKLKGSIQVESVPGNACEFRLLLSTSLATTEALMVEVAGTTYAFPLDPIETIILISRGDMLTLEGNQIITFKEQPISVTWLANLLELKVKVPQSTQAFHDAAKKIPCIILRSGTECLGILVDAVLDRQDILLKPQSALLKRVRNISGATILGNGQVCMVLNPQDLLTSARRGANNTVTQKAQKALTKPIKPKLLLVEDSIIIQTQMKRILESAGYESTIAVDGADGFNKLRGGSFDVVVSDVEMPKMNGLELTSRIRQYPEYKKIPIILVTTLAKEEDRLRGEAAGANAYLTKGDFNQNILLDTLNQLVQ